MPVPQDLTPNDLMREGINQLPGAIVGGLLGAVSGGLSVIGRVVRSPGTAVFDAVDFARSGRRVMGRAAEPSPLLRRRSLASRSEAIEMKLSDLRSGGKRGGRLDQRRLSGGVVRRASAATTRRSAFRSTACRWPCR